MIVPNNYKVLCRFTIGKFETMQFVRVSSLEDCINRLPKNTRIDLLSYLPNFVYGWSSLDSVSPGSVSIHKGMTSIRNLFFDIPSYVKIVRSVVLPDNFFKPKELSDIEYFCSLIVLENIKEYNIETKYITKSKRSNVNIENYVRKNIIEHKNTRLSLNGRDFDFTRFLSDQNNILTEYISNFHIDLYSVYLYHLMIKGGYLTPLILYANKMNIKEDILYVPAHTYYIFQLLYGKSVSVRVKFANDISFDFTQEKLRVRKVYTKVDGTNISIGNKGATPVFINGGVAMRFINE